MGHQCRDHLKTPPIDDISAYAAQWWLWWKSIQPEWRTIDVASRPVHKGTEAWDALQKPGKCGFVLVLLSLMWWRKAPDVSEPS